MLKTIAFIARKQATRREDFRNHYEEVHAPIALPHLPGLQRYVRNHILSAATSDVPSEAIEPGFDCATGFWFPDRAALEEVTRHLASDAAAEIREDELTFMNTEAQVFCGALETLVHGPGLGEELGANAKLLALAKRPAHQSRDAFIARYEEEVIPVLLEGPTRPLRCIQNQTIGLAGMEPPFDCITELWYPESESAPTALSRLAPEADRWLFLQVLECGTAFE
jgi:uncharacterized protein (TIGR02118 family)